MGNTFSNQNSDSNKGEKGTPKMAETMYNMGGKVPSSCVWNLSEADIKEIVLKVGKSFINDFKVATIEIDKNAGMVNALLWLPIDSEHISDTSLANNNEVAIKGIKRLIQKSTQLENFTNRFCPKGKGRPIPEDKKDPKLCAVAVSVQKIFEAYFDKNGVGFQKKYGYKPPECNITARMILQGKDDRKRFRYLEVVKSSARVSDRTDPVPRKPFNRL